MKKISKRELNNRCSKCENHNNGWCKVGNYSFPTVSLVTHSCERFVEKPIYKAIEDAKKELAKDNYDAQIAAMILRDLPEVKAADLSDLAWAIYQDGSAHKNDVLGLIEHLEKYLDIKEAA